ncbi:MAG: hypothetical protein WCX15_02760 [Bacilli bacterium]|jgi:capsular polysaccharide biosynthesis protein
MDLIGLLKQKRQTIISVFLILLVIGLLFLLTQNFKYGTKSKILVIQEGAGKVDPYSVSRSVEYLSDLFSKVIYSNAFFESVMNSDFDIDKSYFGEDYNDMMKNWKKTVSTKTLEDSGIMVISVYHEDNYQATQIALAVNHVLINEHQNYHGLGNSVKLSIIDQPVTSNYPIKPNLVYYFIVLISVSLFISLIYIYLFPERKYDINFFGEQKPKKIILEKEIKQNISNNISKVELKNKASENNNIEDVEIEDVKETINYNEIRKSGDISNLFE